MNELFHIVHRLNNYNNYLLFYTVQDSNKINYEGIQINTSTKLRAIIFNEKYANCNFYQFMKAKNLGCNK